MVCCKFTYYLIFLFVFLSSATIAYSDDAEESSFEELQNRIYESISNNKGDVNLLISEFKRLGGYDANLLLGMAYYYKAELNYSEGDWPESAINYRNAIKYFTQLNDDAKLAIAYNNLGLVYSFMGEYDQSLEAYSRSLDLELDMDNQAGIAQTYQNMANVFSAGLNFDKALEFHIKALEVYHQEKNEISIAATYNNIATIYAQTDRLRLAAENYIKAIDVYRRFDMDHEESIVLSNIGALLTREGDFNEAIKYLERALMIIKSRRDKIGEAKAYALLADAYSGRNDHQQAIFLYHKSMDIAKASDLKNVYIDTKFSLYTALKKAGQYEKALAVYEDYIGSRDTLLKNNPAFTEGIIEKELEHRVFERDKLLQRAGIRERYLFGMFVIVGVLAVLAFVVATYRRRIIQRQKEYEQAQNTLLKERFNSNAVLNYLKSIKQELLQGNNENAVSQLNGFSNMMQLMMENSCQQFIPLRSEIEFLTTYINFQKERYGCEIECEIESNIIQNIDEVMVPSMVTQPFLEHAFLNYNNLRSEVKPAINFAFMRRGNILDVIIEDNLDGVTENGILEERHKNIGISMVHHKSTKIKMQEFMSYLSPLHTEVKTEEGRKTGHRVRFSLPFMVN